MYFIFQLGNTIFHSLEVDSTLAAMCYSNITFILPLLINLTISQTAHSFNIQRKWKTKELFQNYPNLPNTLLTNGNHVF